MALQLLFGGLSAGPQRLERLKSLLGPRPVGDDVQIELVITRCVRILLEHALGFGQAKDSLDIGGIGGDSVLVAEQGSLVVARLQVKATHLGISFGARRVGRAGLVFPSAEPTIGLARTDAWR